MLSHTYQESQYSQDAVNPGYLDPSILAEGKQIDETLIRIRVPGDGNCGFYVLALRFLHLIIQNKQALTNARYLQLLKHMNEENVAENITNRLTFYMTGMAFNGNQQVRLADKCREIISNLLQLLREGKLDTFEQLKKYVHDNRTYYHVLSLIIFLGPALRSLSVSIKPQLRGLNKIAGYDVIDLESKDGDKADSGQLNLIAAFFDWHLTTYNNDGTKLSASYGDLQQTKSPLLTEDKSDDSLSSNSAAALLDDVPTPQEPLPAESKNEVAITLFQGHWDLVLPLNEYTSPPFYFGFDLTGVTFNRSNRDPHSPTEAQKQLVLENKNMQKFRDMIGSLRAEATKLSNRDKPQLMAVISRLETHQNTLFIPNNSTPAAKSEQLVAFNACDQAVKDAYRYFQATDKRTIKNILVNLAIFIVTGGIGYLILGGLHRRSTGRFTFFHKPATLREELIKASNALATLQKERLAPATSDELKPLPTFKQWSTIKL